MNAKTSIPSSRRGFLSQLCALPMIGGGVTLIGAPTAVAAAIDRELLLTYSTWLDGERRWLSWELCGDDKSQFDTLHRCVFFDNEAGRYIHNSPQPSTRAALILSAAGLPITGGACG